MKHFVSIAQRNKLYSLYSAEEQFNIKIEK